MSSLRATICAASIVALGLVAPLSAVADTPTALKPMSVDPAPSVAKTKGRAVVKLDGCTLSGSNGRSASFSSKMVAGRSAASIELRFDLFTRPISGGKWTAVKGVPKFGAWDRPSSRSVVWSKSVGGLTAGQSYRVRVTHRWLSKSGRVIRRNVIASPACHQLDTRADLAAIFVGAKPLGNGNKLYMLLVRNLGRRASAGFSVGMLVNGVELPTVRVRSLGARKSRLVTFTAAGCASGSRMRFEADFSKELAEPNEANNVAEIACEFVGG